MSQLDLGGLRVALVHDWLTGMRGGERVLEELCRMFPAAHLYTVVRVPGATSTTIEEMDIRTSWIQRLPFTPRRFRMYLPLFPSAIESFDLRGYDLVVSTRHCVAKGIIPDPRATHVAYVFTPMRYVWDVSAEYLRPSRARLVTRLLGPLLATYLRLWDASSNARVDRFLGCSEHVARRIRRFYHRPAEVVYPPVDTDRFTPDPTVPREHLLVVSALVPYKAIELVVEAARGLDLALVVAGEGPERERLARDAPGNVRFTGAVDDRELLQLFRGAIAFLLPGEEDFGIAALEAQACGTPVVAYGRGGALETVIDGVTGAHFARPRADDLRKAIARVRRAGLDPEAIRRNAVRFSRSAFRAEMEAEIRRALDRPVGPTEEARP